MKQSVNALFRTIGRLLFLAVFGYLLSAAVVVVAIVLLIIWQGSLDAGLSALPRSRSFEPSILGYCAGISAAGLGFLTAGLLRITASKTDFYRAAWTQGLLVAVVAATVAAAGGVGLGFAGLSRELSIQLAFGTGIWVGIVLPLVVRLAPRLVTRSADLPDPS